MRNEKTTAAAIEAVQEHIGRQTVLVTQLEELSDSLVKPEGTVEISKSGTYDVSGFASAVVEAKSHYWTMMFPAATSSLVLPEELLALPNFIIFLLCYRSDIDAKNKIINMVRRNANNEYVDFWYIGSDGEYHRSRGEVDDSGRFIIPLDDVTFADCDEEGYAYFLVGWDGRT